MFHISKTCTRCEKWSIRLDRTFSRVKSRREIGAISAWLAQFQGRNSPSLFRRWESIMTDDLFLLGYQLTRTCILTLMENLWTARSWRMAGQATGRKQDRLVSFVPVLFSKGKLGRSEERVAINVIYCQTRGSSILFNCKTRRCRRYSPRFRGTLVLNAINSIFLQRGYPS